MEHRAIIECLLFAAGEPVEIGELARVIGCKAEDVRGLLESMNRDYESNGHGFRLHITEDSCRLTTDAELFPYVEALLQPKQGRASSRSLMETLAVIAYRQPVTRAEIEAVRGVRCEHSVTKLIKAGVVAEVGRKDCVGRPALLGTTELFLHKLGIKSIAELPPLEEGGIEV